MNVVVFVLFGVFVDPLEMSRGLLGHDGDVVAELDFPEDGVADLFVEVSILLLIMLRAPGVLVAADAVLYFD